MYFFSVALDSCNHTRLFDCENVFDYMHFSEALTCVADCASRDNRETDNLRKVDTVEQRQPLIYKLTSEERCRL